MFVDGRDLILYSYGEPAANMMTVTNTILIENFKVQDTFKLKIYAINVSTIYVFKYPYSFPYFFCIDVISLCKIVANSEMPAGVSRTHVLNLRGQMPNHYATTYLGITRKPAHNPRSNLMECKKFPICTGLA